MEDAFVQLGCVEFVSSSYSYYNQSWQPYCWIQCYKSSHKSVVDVEVLLWKVAMHVFAN